MNTILEYNESLSDIASAANTKQRVSTYTSTIEKGSIEEIELEGKRKFYKLRTKWSWTIII